MNQRKSANLISENQRETLYVIDDPLSANMELAKKIGLKASRRIEFWNGTIDCRLLKYDLYAGKKD
ncbi:hypothetical protein [Algoriphagus halophytocola]|uniref:hypothetical protein n=1 Tax=Algoriphagus halophytocola TaxID=2991499 RepID=UPI0037BEAE99